MEIKSNGLVQRYKITALLCLMLAVHAVSCVAREPEPRGAMQMALEASPMPRSLIIRSIPSQMALANSSFHFSLRPYLELSRLELSYRVTNAYVSSKTTWSVRAWASVSGLPSGVVPISNRPEDCEQPFLLWATYGCLLHFYVDNDAYIPDVNDKGPVVSGSVGWIWGHHSRKGGLQFSLKPMVSQSLGNVISPLMAPVQFLVTPSMQDGLFYDAVTGSIIGKPTRIGDYHFTVHATDGYSMSLPQECIIKSDVNLIDKPKWKRQYSIVAATEDKDYRLNLMSLIETKPSFGVSNQVHFRMDIHHTSRYPSWIALDPATETILQGHVTPDDRGKTKEVTLIATSNTGGDSEPLVLQIPVAYALEKKPSFEKGIELKGAAGAVFKRDFRPNMMDPAQDDSLKIILDKVDPAAPWLSVTRLTHLEGTIPENAAGLTYWLTLYANTNTGGNSEPLVIPLIISEP